MKTKQSSVKPQSLRFLRPLLVGLGTTSAAGAIGALVVAACAINPQPLPPDNADGSFNGGDAGSALGNDKNDSTDAASTPSAAPDGGATGGGNNDSDAGDGGGDGASDAGSNDAGISDASDSG
jgi:hypothetical protein